MKFFDVLKISLHNMRFNKLRTLLVTTVLLVLSTLVTMIMAFSINMTSATNVMISDNQPLDIRMEYVDFGGGYGQRVLDNDSIEKLENYFDQNRDKFCSLYYTISSDYMIDFTKGHSYSDSIAFIKEDTNLLQGEVDPLIAGRLWSKQDIGKPYMWISKDFAINQGVQVGDTIGVNINSGMNSYNENLTVMGIINQSQGDSYMYGPEIEILLDSSILKDNHFKISHMQLQGPKNIDHNIFDLMEIKKYTKENSTGDYRTGTSGIMMTSQKADSSQMALYISLGVVGGAIFLSLIVILLSIGCVSNSIEITVEQNRKFFGVMKAVGLRNKTVKQIVRWQAVIMILLSVLAATGIGVGILYAVKPIIAEALQIGINEFSFSMPIYVPFIVFFMQIILVLIFTRKSLNRISKMDVVSVISEVN